MSNLPVTTNFYDLFAGGCAITHRALLESRYKNYYANDIDFDGIQLFMDSIQGNYTLEKTQNWISRETFFELKNTSPYIRYVWSFGNNGRDYLYGKDIEPYKKAWHYAVFFKDYTLSKELNFDLSSIDNEKDIYKRYLKAKKIIKEKANENISRLNEFERTQSLESLNRLQSLQSLQSLQLSNVSFEKVKIYKDSVIYCDIPYCKTNIYAKQSFDYESFYKWAEEQTELVVISEYYCPKDRFVCVAETKKRSLYCATKEYATDKIERLYVPKNQFTLYKELMRKSRGELF